MKYLIQCCECKAKRTYEGETLGDCMTAAEKDGWERTGEFAKRVCRECNKIALTVLDEGSRFKQGHPKLCS